MKIAIIGGYGNMGKWAARFLKSDGFQVVISGRDRAKLEAAARELGVAYADNKKAAADADAVIISVPIDSFEEVTKEIGPRIRTGQLVFDIDVMPPPPAERITFQASIDVNLLQQLGQTSPITAAAGATA